jgi:hypothetical protein
MTFHSVCSIWGSAKLIGRRSVQASFPWVKAWIPPARLECSGPLQDWQTESRCYHTGNFSYDRQSPPSLQLSSQAIAAAASVPFAHGIHQWSHPAFRPPPPTSIPVIPCIQLLPPPTEVMLISDPGLCHGFTKPKVSTVAHVS